MSMQTALLITIAALSASAANEALLYDGRLNPACTWNCSWNDKGIFNPIEVTTSFDSERMIGGVKITSQRSWVNCGVKRASFYAIQKSNSKLVPLAEHLAFRPSNTYGDIFAAWKSVKCSGVKMVIEDTWDRKGNYYDCYSVPCQPWLPILYPGAPLWDAYSRDQVVVNDKSAIGASPHEMVVNPVHPVATVQIAELEYLERLPEPDDHLSYPDTRLVRDWQYQECAPKSNPSLVANTTADTSVPDRIGKDISQVAINRAERERSRREFLKPFIAKARQFVYCSHFIIGDSILFGYDDVTDWTWQEWRNVPDTTEHNPSGLFLATIHDDGTVTRETLLLKANGGVIRDPAVSPDAAKVVFSMRENMESDDYHLYEINLTSRQVKQLTFDAEWEGCKFPASDTEPSFAADGSIVFQSTRCSHSLDCWPLNASNLYRMDQDGSNMRRLGFDQVSTFYPQPLADGRILYGRWEYNDRTSGYAFGLMTMYPDGTRQLGFALNNSQMPVSTLHARGIPGSANVMLIAGGHHCGQKGRLVEVDPSVSGDFDCWTYDRNKTAPGYSRTIFGTTRARWRGKENVKLEDWPYGQYPGAALPTHPGLYSIAGSAHDGTPGRTPYQLPRFMVYPATETGESQIGPQWAYPYPLGNGRFLVSFLPEGDRFQRGPFCRRMGIYAMDDTGRRELLAYSSNNHLMSAVPVMKRNDLPYRTSPVDNRKGFGTYYVENVCHGAAVKGVNPGEAKKLRVIAIGYRASYIGWNSQYFAKMVGTDGKIGTPVSAGNGSYDTKHVLGEVDIEADGSCMFNCPVRTPVYFQLIDKDGCCIQTMRSWSTLHGGESLSCIGCHERREEAAPIRSSLASKRAPQELQPVVPGMEHPFLAELKAKGPLADVGVYMGVNRAEKPDGSKNNGGFAFAKFIQPILDRNCVKCHNGSVPEPPIEKLGGIPPKPVCFDLRGLPGEIPSSDDNSHRRYSRSYLHLACYGFDNDKINFAHGMDHVPFKPARSFGSSQSDWYKMLAAGHPNSKGERRVSLSKDELRTFACWIDLCVPFAGAYTEANTWNDDQQNRYSWFQNKRVYFAWKELNDLRKAYGMAPVPIQDMLPNVVKPKRQKHWYE